MERKNVKKATTLLVCTLFVLLLGTTVQSAKATVEFNAGPGDSVVWNLTIDIDPQVDQATYDAIDAMLAYNPATPNPDSEAWINEFLAAVNKEINLKMTVDSITTGFDPIYGPTKVVIVTFTAKYGTEPDTQYRDPAILVGDYFVAYFKLVAHFDGDTWDSLDEVEARALAAEAVGNLSGVEMGVWAEMTGSPAVTEPEFPWTSFPLTPTSLLLKPTDWDFSALLTFIADTYAYERQEACSSTETCVGVFEKASTWSQAQSYYGIKTFEATTNTIHVVWSYDTFMDAWTEEYGSMEDAYGVQDMETLFGAYVAYDAKGFLEAVALYASSSVLLKEEYLGTAQSAGPITADSGVVMAQPGAQVPSQSEVLGTGGGTLNIPGYPVEVVGLLGLLFVAGLVVYKKRRR
ncbi:MAG: hypothetical protein Kow0069_33380 [Promethearchaeota archaeon]